MLGIILIFVLEYGRLLAIPLILTEIGQFLSTVFSHPVLLANCE